MKLLQKSGTNIGRNLPQQRFATNLCRSCILSHIIVSQELVQIAPGVGILTAAFANRNPYGR
jgi:hypothetical protein